MKKFKSDPLSKAQNIGKLTSIPFIMAGGPLIGFFMGDWLDEKFGFEPYGKVILIIMGFLASAREVGRLIRSSSK